MDWRRETGEGGHRRQCEPYTHDLFAVTCSANEGANLRRAAVASLDWHVHTASGPVIRRFARCARLTTASDETKFVRDGNKQSLSDGAAAPGSSDPAFRRKGADDPCPTEASPSPTRRGPPGPDSGSAYERGSRIFGKGRALASSRRASGRRRSMCPAKTPAAWRLLSPADAHGHEVGRAHPGQVCPWPFLRLLEIGRPLNWRSL